jgi:hypothetical protein
MPTTPVSRFASSGSKWQFGTGPDSLRRIIEAYVLPEVERGQSTRDMTWGQVTSITSDPNWATNWGTQTAQALAGDLFKAGGPIYSEIAKARGASIGSGFSPEGATGKVDTILGTAAEGVGRAGLQSAQEAEKMRLGLLGTQYGMENANLGNAISSLFSGWAGAESLNLAKKATEPQGIFGKMFSWLL